MTAAEMLHGQRMYCFSSMHNHTAHMEIHTEALLSGHRIAGRYWCEASTDLEGYAPHQYKQTVNSMIRIHPHGCGLNNECKHGGSDTYMDGMRSEQRHC